MSLTRTVRSLPGNSHGSKRPGMRAIAGMRGVGDKGCRRGGPGVGTVSGSGASGDRSAGGIDSSQALTPRAGTGAAGRGSAGGAATDGAGATVAKVKPGGGGTTLIEGDAPGRERGAGAAGSPPVTSIK